MVIELRIYITGLHSEMGAWTMNKKGQTVCFTGHRQISETTASVGARVKDIAEGLIQQGNLCFCAGGARGFDALAARTILRLQEKSLSCKCVFCLRGLSAFQQMN